MSIHSDRQESKDDSIAESKRIERIGLTSAEAEKGYADWGFNELPHVVISVWWIFLIQFTGLMPFMLEFAAIVALAVQDWIDFAILAAILLCNGYLAFHEELKAKASLDELTSNMEQKIPVLRDGVAENMLTRLLVPGDVILMVGGCSTPADVEWIEGDVLSIDTASITGESLPRNYPSEQYGKTILSGTTVKAGEAYCIVRKTGINTEVGRSLAQIMDDKTTVKISLFEQKVFYMLKIIILCTLVDVIVIFLVQGIARKQFTADEIRKLLLTIVSIVVASIPVAMPIVLQVTMALGAGRMARQFNAICTSLPALQDISSMSILCSDKTGTLTTAKITIHAESVWHNEKFSKEDVALYSALASNRDKKEDPIDRSVINHFDSLFGPEGLTKCAEFTKVRGVGFNPIYKRVVFEFTHLTLGNVTIAKGLAAKVMDTTDGGEDDAADQWKVENFNEMDPEVSRADDDFSKAGYKTLGIAVKFNEGPFMFAGILPMLDPPRHDSARTIKSLLSAGIKVKMITGDHLNIAKETARLVGLGVSIYTGEETRNDTPEKNLLIWNADGFAQVLPRDKREVVDILKNEYHVVVGMTGDGVNDAPAISAAQCGIAVDDATDAAKNAAAIILTSPGLSAVYSAVVESRRIFRKLKAYVTYRFAVSMQIVVVLTLLIFIANCPINSLYIILLALFNDITMLPIAYDRQQASAGPEVADVTKIMILCCILGTMQTGFSLLWAFVSYQTGFFQSNFDVWECKLQAQAGIWLQISIATELLIFSTRAPSFIFFSVPPSIGLFSSVLAGCLLFSLFAGVIPYFGYLHINDIVIIWAYNIICLFLIDFVKVMYLKSSKQNIDVLSEIEEEKVKKEEEVGDEILYHLELGVRKPNIIQDQNEEPCRSISAIRRMSSWIDTKGGIYDSTERKESGINIILEPNGQQSSTAIIAARESIAKTGPDASKRDIIIVARGGNLLGSSAALRGSGVNLRPYTPAEAAIARGKKLKKVT